VLLEHLTGRGLTTERDHGFFTLATAAPPDLGDRETACGPRR
jgi:hypothetical protein